MRAPSKYKFVSLQSVALSAFIFTLLCAVGESNYLRSQVDGVPDHVLSA